MKKTFLIALIFLLPLSSYATLFHNAYLSFELPPQWQCQMDGTEWLCKSSVGAQSKEAVIILTAKEMGPEDTLGAYENYLKNPKASVGNNGKPQSSIVKHVKRTTINGQEWVDSLHLGGEIPGYYTRYLATVKKQLAVLVTFSAHQVYFTKYSNDFFKAIQSLNVTATADTSQASAGGGSAATGTGESLGVPTGAAMNPGDMQQEDLPAEPTSSTSSETKKVAAGVTLLALAAYAYLKLRKK